MNPEEIENQFIDCINKKDIKGIEMLIDEHVADDFINHTALFGTSSDKKGLKEMFRRMLRLFPNIKFTIIEMIYEDDIVCHRHTIDGMGTSTPIRGSVALEFTNGKITGRWIGVSKKDSIRESLRALG